MGIKFITRLFDKDKKEVSTIGCNVADEMQ
jgi:hypothetical protein